jgi:hypothetical protein
MSAYRRKMPISKSQEIALASIGVMPREGYTGWFCTANAPNAIRAGTKIKKVRQEEGDTHPLGATGTVLGSISPNDLGIMYFIEWDDKPRHAIATIAWKVARA